MRRRGDAAHPPLVQGSGPAPMWIQGVGLGAWFLERDVLNASGDSKLLWSFPRQMSPSSDGEPSTVRIKGPGCSSRVQCREWSWRLD